MKSSFVINRVKVWYYYILFSPLDTICFVRLCNILMDSFSDQRDNRDIKKNLNHVQKNHIHTHTHKCVCVCVCNSISFFHWWNLLFKGCPGLSFFPNHYSSHKRQQTGVTDAIFKPCFPSNYTQSWIWHYPEIFIAITHRYLTYTSHSY